MKNGHHSSGGWTLTSVLLASGCAVITLILFLQLWSWHLWRDDEGWSFVLAPAIVGSIVLAVRHPAQIVLTTIVFLPVLAALMFLAEACLPIKPLL